MQIRLQCLDIVLQGFQIDIFVPDDCGHTRVFEADPTHDQLELQVAVLSLEIPDLVVEIAQHFIVLSLEKCNVSLQLVDPVMRIEDGRVRLLQMKGVGWTISQGSPGMARRRGQVSKLKRKELFVNFDETSSERKRKELLEKSCLEFGVSC